VVWITLLAFIFDYALRKLSHVCFPWFHAQMNSAEG
jgi:NitT/TauT family transport system permease protein